MTTFKFLFKNILFFPIALFIRMSLRAVRYNMETVQDLELYESNINQDGVTKSIEANK